MLCASRLPARQRGHARLELPPESAAVMQWLKFTSNERSIRQEQFTRKDSARPSERTTDLSLRLHRRHEVRLRWACDRPRGQAAHNGSALGDLLGLPPHRTNSQLKLGNDMVEAYSYNERLQLVGMTAWTTLALTNTFDSPNSGKICASADLGGRHDAPTVSALQLRCVQPARRPPSSGLRSR